MLSHLIISGGAKERGGRFLFKRCELAHWCISQKEIKLAQVLQPQHLKRNVSHSILWNVSHLIPRNMSHQYPKNVYTYVFRSSSIDLYSKVKKLSSSSVSFLFRSQINFSPSKYFNISAQIWSIIRWALKLCPTRLRTQAATQRHQRQHRTSTQSLSPSMNWQRWTVLVELLNKLSMNWQR